MVVLPDPECPVRNANSPFLRWKETSRSAYPRFGYSLDTCVNLITGPSEDGTGLVAGKYSSSHLGIPQPRGSGPSVAGGASISPQIQRFSTGKTKARTEVQTAAEAMSKRLAASACANRRASSIDVGSARSIPAM